MSKLIYINGDSSDRDNSISIPVGNLRVIEAITSSTFYLWHDGPQGAYNRISFTNGVSGKDFKKLCKDFVKAVNNDKTNRVVLVDKFEGTSFSNEVNTSALSLSYTTFTANETISGDLTVDGTATVEGIVYTSASVVATAAGDGAGVIGSGVSMVTVASSNADHIVTLPTPSIGQIIYIVEATGVGYELRSNDPENVSINGGAGVGYESAIAGATAYIRCVAVSTTAWVVSQFAAAGTESAVEVANNT